MRIGEHLANNKAPFLSLEFFPPKDKKNYDAFFETVDKLRAANPLFASVTYGAGGGTQEGTLEISARLKKDFGLEPMPHYTCVGASQKRIRAFLDELEGAGVENALALRGDLPPDMDRDMALGNGFSYASDLISFVREEKPGLCLGAAAYPNAHPESPTIRKDLETTKIKTDAGASFLVTQVVFDNRVYFDFVDRLRAMGVDTPVIPGVLPIRSLASLRFILSKCSVSFPGPLIAELERAEAEGGPEAVREAGLAHAVRQTRELLDGGAPGAHLYTLNKPGMCLHIAGELGFGAA